MIWQQLKDFCNSLDEKQLEQKVMLWREDSAIVGFEARILAKDDCLIKAIETDILQEDHYIDPENDENGCFPETDAKGIIEDTEAYPNGMDDLEKVYDKGFPILWEEF